MRSNSLWRSAELYVLITLIGAHVAQPQHAFNLKDPLPKWVYRPFKNTEGVSSNCVAFSPDGKWVVSGHTHTPVHSLRMHLLHASNGIPQRVSPDEFTFAPVSATFSPDSKLLLMIFYNRVDVYEIPSLKYLRSLKVKQEIEVVQCSPDGQSCIVAGNGFAPQAWNYLTGERLFTLPTQGKGYCWAQFAPDGKRIWAEENDKILYECDAKTGAMLRTLTFPNAHFTKFALTPDGKSCVLATFGGSLELRELTAGKLLRRFGTVLSKFPFFLTALALSPNGKRIVSGNMLGAIAVWDLQSGSQLSLFTPHDNDVNGVAVSPDSKYYASIGDSKVCLWNLP